VASLTSILLPGAPLSVSPDGWSVRDDGLARVGQQVLSDWCVRDGRYASAHPKSPALIWAWVGGHAAFVSVALNAAAP